MQVLIQDGDLVEGTLCKKTLGASEGGLVHTIWMEEGPAAARAFLSQIQYTVNYWLLHHGFSIGIGDTVADTATMQIISRTIQQVGHVPVHGSWHVRLQHSWNTVILRSSHHAAEVLLQAGIAAGSSLGIISPCRLPSTSFRAGSAFAARGTPAHPARQDKTRQDKTRRDETWTSSSQPG